MKEVRSTLEGFKRTYPRASGNTTRQIDLAISQLFDGVIVEVRDHHNDFRSNRRLLEMILKRLKYEHEIGIEKVKINTNKLTIELI